MSADNTIIVLGYRNKEDKKEFRVAHVQAEDNMYYEPNYPKSSPVIDIDWVLSEYTFRNKIVFNDYESALNYAFKLEEEHVYVEYGVSTHEHDFYIPFDLIEGENAITIEDAFKLMKEFNLYPVINTIINEYGNWYKIHNHPNSKYPSHTDDGDLDKVLIKFVEREIGVYEIIKNKVFKTQKENI